MGKIATNFISLDFENNYGSYWVEYRDRLFQMKLDLD